MNINYDTLESDVYDGTFKQHLQEELIVGFRQLQMAGERLPLASYYAAQIAEIVNRDRDFDATLKFELYQEILAACEHARAAVLGEDDKIQA